MKTKRVKSKKKLSKAKRKELFCAEVGRLLFGERITDSFKNLDWSNPAVVDRYVILPPRLFDKLVDLNCKYELY